MCRESYTKIPALNNGYGKYAYSYSLLMEHALRFRLNNICKKLKRKTFRSTQNISGTYLTYVADVRCMLIEACIRRNASCAVGDITSRHIFLREMWFVDCSCIVVMIVD